MPEQFDPVWEYASNDSEIEEFLSEESNKPYVRIIARIPYNDSTSFIRHPNSKVKLTQDEIDHIRLLESHHFFFRKCRHCKTLIVLRKKRKTQRFCSTRCSMQYTWKHKRKNEQTIATQCKGCHQSFKPIRQSQTYCSYKCSTVKRPSPINHRIVFLSGMISANCLGCGNVITKRGYKKYCSVKCRTRVINNRYYYKCKNVKMENSS